MYNVNIYLASFNVVMEFNLKSKYETALFMYYAWRWIDDLHEFSISFSF